MDLNKLNVSNGNGEAVRALVTVLRAPGATVITPNSLVNWPTNFIATTGPLLADGTLDPAKSIVFWGHIVGSTIVIDQLAPGYTDTYGSAVGDVVVIKPNTWGQDTLINKVKAIDTDIIQRSDESVPNYIASGGIWSLLSGLNGTMTALVGYIDGYRNTIATIATRTFTASKDTYIDVLRNTTTNAFSLVYTEVANGAASPALAANSVRIGKIVTNASAITSIIQYGFDTLQNPFLPTIETNSSPVYFSVQADSITFTAPFDCIVEATHQKGAWGFAGGTFVTTLNCNNSAVKIAEIRGYVTGQDTVPRQIHSESVFVNIKKGQSYTVTLAALNSSMGGGEWSSMYVKCIPR